VVGGIAVAGWVCRATFKHWPAALRAPQFQLAFWRSPLVSTAWSSGLFNNRRHGPGHGGRFFPLPYRSGALSGALSGVRETAYTGIPGYFNLLKGVCQGN